MCLGEYCIGDTRIVFKNHLNNEYLVAKDRIQSNSGSNKSQLKQSLILD